MFRVDLSNVDITRRHGLRSHRDQDLVCRLDRATRDAARNAAVVKGYHCPHAICRRGLAVEGFRHVRQNGLQPRHNQKKIFKPS